ncbi:MAG: LysM peptidoglycan-binding domain-containing protein [Anaerolineae bacterium]|nr:LysM peptidoglycan-binding domain-containing protein [Anaerolineae bacterium]
MAGKQEEMIKGAHGRVGKTYVVQAGDSLSKIAEEVYGDANRWSEIFEANKDKISDPNAISVGQKLVIP